MKKLLIIEDDQIVGSIYRRKFQQEGFEVHIATDGESGAKAVFTYEPDLVILDLMLPRKNGVEVLKEVRAQPRFKELPVLVLTNAYMSDLVKEAKAAGANECLVKANCTPRQLVELVKRALGETSTMDTAMVRRLRGEDSEETESAPVEETATQSQQKDSFLTESSDLISDLRRLLQTFIKSPEAGRSTALFALYRRLQQVSNASAVSGLNTFSRMASATEALLKELYEKPKNINASSTRTIAHSIDFLDLLLQNSAKTEGVAPNAPNILVVDDEIISRRAIVQALGKAQLKCIAVDDPDAALKMVEENKFDLVFLDVDMPGMSGFDLCKRLRSFPLNNETPVIFVTGLTDFESRAQSMLSGGNDLIAKPFLFMELAVKSLNYVIRRQFDLPVSS